MLASTPMTALAAETQPQPAYWAYVGTYTGAKSKGIYVLAVDDKGTLGSPRLAAEIVHPTFLTIHRNQRFLYAANETGNYAGKKSGSITAYAIDARTGNLKELNRQASGGGGPCHVSVDRTGKFVLVANYGGGSVAVLPIDENGGLREATAFVQHKGSSVNKQRQEGPHAHYIVTDPANRFVLACDLGLDQVLVYRFDASKGTLTPNDPPYATLAPGAGPRHLAFHPDGKWVYVINELNSTVTVFAFDKDKGTLKEIQTISTLPADYKGNTTTAEIAVHPSGRFVYGSNRGHDSIAVFAVEGGSGKLTIVEQESTGGKTPRHFALHPNGRFLYAENQASDNIVAFQLDPEKGELSPTGQVVDGIGAPVCMEFVPAGSK